MTVDAALRLFAEHGYEAVTVADICAAADIAPRTFFRYFPAKEDVLAEPGREMAARLAEAITAAPADMPPPQVLRTSLRQVGEHVVGDRERLAGYFAVAAQVGVLRANPFIRLNDRERDVTDLLRARPSTPDEPEWRTRLLVATFVAAYRIWLDAVRADDLVDPLAHLDELLDAAG